MAQLPMTCFSTRCHFMCGVSKLSIRAAQGEFANLTNRASHSSSKIQKIPSNVAKQEKISKSKFSPLRSRDTTGAHIAVKGGSSMQGRMREGSNAPKDARVSAYDASNTVALSSVTQNNVPQPFNTQGSVPKSNSVAISGGQWAQTDKYVSADLHDHHYRKTNNQMSSDKKSRANTTASASGLVTSKPRNVNAKLDSFFHSEPCGAIACSVTNRNHPPLVASITHSTTCSQQRGYLNNSSLCSCLNIKYSYGHPPLVTQHKVSSGFHYSLRPSLSSNILPFPTLVLASHYSTGNSNRTSDTKTSTSSNSSGDIVTNRIATLTMRQKLQRAVKEYGTTVIVFHVTISLASLGLSYLLVSSGIDVSGIIQSLGIELASSVDSTSTPSISYYDNGGYLGTKTTNTDSLIVTAESGHRHGSSNADVTHSESSRHSSETGLSRAESVATGVSTFVIAYAIHKCFAPARIAATLTATPFIVRSLRARGILKPPKSI